MKQAETPATASDLRAEPERDPQTRAGYADFLARVAHDLRSPLGIVLHVVQQVEADLAAHLTDEHRTLLGLSRRGLRRLEAFVDRMRLVSEIETGQLRASKRNCDPSEVVKAGVDAARALEPRAEVAVAVEVGDGLKEMTVDPRLFSHAVAELVCNAVAHARRAVRVSVTRGDREIVVAVEDDGAGVSEAAAETLFRRFVTRKARGGLGIGLSLARDLIELNGGKVETAGSSTLPVGRPGTVGARFIVVLPQRESKVVTVAAPSDGSARVPPEMGDVRLLIVDDDQDSAELYQYLLAQRGLDVSVAASVELALDAARENPFDIVMSDINLPDGDGCELLVKLEKIRPIRGIAVTGYAGDDSKKRCAEAGFRRTFVKPADVQGVIDCISDLAAEVRAAPPVTG